MRNDDEMLRLYLLGNLPQEESHRLEERLLAEEDLGELSEAIETEVLEAWSRGELSAAQRERIELVLGHSPRLRSRAALLRDLARIGAEAPRQTVGRVVPFPPRLGPLRPMARFASLAAGLMMMTGAIWLALSLAPNAGDLRHQAGGAIPGTSPTPIPQETPAPGEIADIGETPPAPAPPTPAPPAPVVTAVFQLATTALRGEVEIPAISPPAEANRVELQILLAPEDEGFASYTAVLRRKRKAQRFTGLAVKQTSKGAAVILEIPRERLPEGRYEIELSGVTASGESEAIAFPEFEFVGDLP